MESTKGRWLTYASVPLLAAALTATYFVAPDFYLKWVLEVNQREWQVVEIATVIFAFAATALLAYATVKIWQQTRFDGQIPNLPGGALLIGVIALATFFFAGEEISWGQSYLGWQTPEKFQNAMGNTETNLHNNDWISLQALGSVFIVVMFVGLPIVWKFRSKLSLPADWAPAVAEGPVVLAVVLAFLWTKLKDVYLLLTHEQDPMHSRLYVEFIEQMNEHKELFLAVALFMYGLYRLRWIKKHEPKPAEPQPA